MWNFDWNPDISREHEIKKRAASVIDDKVIKYIEKLAIQSKAENLAGLDTEHMIWLPNQGSIQFYIRIWFDGKYNIILEEMDAGDIAYIVFETIICEKYEDKIKEDNILKVDILNPDNSDDYDLGISK